MKNHLKVEMKPEIIAKASPNFQKIDAKAIAGVNAEDIIERNVIAEYNTDEDDDDDEKEGAGESE